MDEEKINHPKHYHPGQFEAIEVIEEVGSGFCRGNALKYLSRYKHKGTPADDLQKAAWYIRRLRSEEAFTPMAFSSAVEVVNAWGLSNPPRIVAVWLMISQELPPEAVEALDEAILEVCR